MPTYKIRYFRQNGGMPDDNGKGYHKILYAKDLNEIRKDLFNMKPDFAGAMVTNADTERTLGIYNFDLKGLPIWESLVRQRLYIIDPLNGRIIREIPLHELKKRRRR